MTESSEQTKNSMMDSLIQKTGRSLIEWINICSEQPFIKHGEIVKYLKADHDINHALANLITLQYLQSLSQQDDP